MSTPRSRALLALLAALVAAPPLSPRPAAGQTGSGPGGGRDVDAYVRRAMEAWEVPGLAVAVVRSDTVLLLRGWGVLEEGEPATVDANTIFEITSGSKSFTATLAGMLVSEGRLGWDDPVVEHLPDFELHDPYVTRNVTVRDLLAHRTGLAYGSSVRDGPYGREELVRRMRYLGPRHPFRSGFAYHHLAYLAVAEILEGITGEGWDDMVRRRLFEPLGMERSSTTIETLFAADNAATPHEMVGGEVRPVEPIDRDNVGPALSLNSSAADLARWLRFHLSDGAVDGRALISPEVARELRAPQTVIRLDDRWRDGRPFADFYPEAEFMAHGLGWFLHDFRDHKVAEYFGRYAEMAFMPGADLGVVVLMNRPADLRYALMFWLFDTYLGVDGPDWSERMLAETREAAATRAAAAREARPTRGDDPPTVPAERLAGTYHDPLYGEVEVRTRDGGLFLRFSDVREGPLEHWDGDTWRIRWTQPRFGTGMVRFDVSEGRVRGVDVDGLTRFERVP